MGSLESKVKFNHETAEQETERKKLKKGWHFGVVTGAERLLSKEKPETQNAVQYKMIKVTLKPVRDQNDITTVVGRGMDDYWCLPFWDESWDGLDFEVETKDGPVHIMKYLQKNMIIFNENVRDRLAALMGDDVPARPVRIGDGPYLFKGEEIESDRYKECNTESKAAAGDVSERLWNDGPEELVDKGCYFLIGYDEESQYPNSPRLRAFSATPPIDRKTGEELPVYFGEMEGSETTSTEAVEEEAPKATKGTNGAKGKPSASAKTVAAAAATKKAAGKPAAKSARK